MTRYPLRTHPAAGSAAATRVLLIGEPSPLRSAVAQQLRTDAALLGCLDARSELPPALLSAVLGGTGLGWRKRRVRDRAPATRASHPPPAPVPVPGAGRSL